MPRILWTGNFFSHFVIFKLASRLVKLCRILMSVLYYIYWCCRTSCFWCILLAREFLVGIMLYNCIQVTHQLYNDLGDNAEYQQWRFNQHNVFILFVRFDKELFINIWFIV
jgi:hypothetical protein